jgi:hypothetical protein
MSGILDTAGMLALFGLVSFAFGYLVPKLIIWGGITALVAKLVTVFSSVEFPFESIIPHMLDLALAYPSAGIDFITTLTSTHGILGMIIGGAIMAGGLILFVSGAILALFTWPEILFIRVLVGVLL